MFLLFISVLKFEAEGLGIAIFPEALAQELMPMLSRLGHRKRD